MTKKELIIKLNEIYQKIENLADENLNNVLKKNERTADELGDIIQTLEDEDIESDKKDEE